MKFDGDAFISSAPLDNVPLKDGGKGWIANLHRALEARVGHLLGKQPAIWPESNLSGDEMLEKSHLERLKRVASMVPVVSPAYINSESAKRELVEFWQAAEAQGGVRLGDKSRVFKVLKTPVPREKQAVELQTLLGYEFFKVDPETGKVRELDEVFGEEAERDFFVRLDDLAQDICRVLAIMEGTEQRTPQPIQPERSAIFLAETTTDLKEYRDAMRRDLLQHGYTVLPARALPPVASTLKALVREDLARCRMSIHMVGKNYGLVPEGAAESLLEIQNELAIERGQKGEFSRLLWIPTGLQVEDERQLRVIEHLRMDPRIEKGADLLETFLEDLRTVVHDRLKLAEEWVKCAKGNVARLYLMYDRRDAAATAPWANFLFEQGLDVVHPMLEGDEVEIREFHEENLSTCDGALIFYGAANECWVRRKLRELQKSVGYGRVDPMPAVAIILIPPTNAAKEHFRTHEAIILPQWDALSPGSVRPFISQSLQHHADSLDLPIDDEDIALGTRLGRYEIVALLGAGGWEKCIALVTLVLTAKLRSKSCPETGSQTRPHDTNSAWKRRHLQGLAIHALLPFMMWGKRLDETS
jgi:hypothetical protein